MLAKLISFGLTETQATQLIETLGLESEGDLAHITEADLLGLGLKPIPARRILAVMGVGGPSSFAGTLTVRLDKGDVAVAEIENPEDLLAVILAPGRSTFDKKAAAGKLGAMGRPVVVKKGSPKEILPTETVTFWQRGSLRAKVWGREENPVVTASSLFVSDERVEIDPCELMRSRRLVALDNGFNAESGADWGNVSMPRRALLVLAALDGEQVAEGDSVNIAEALSARELSGKWLVLERRANSSRIAEIQSHLTARLADIDTPESAGGSAILVAIFGRETGRSPGYGSGRSSGHTLTPTAEAALSSLFLSMYSLDELRRFLRYGPSGEEVCRALPGGTASPASVASEAVVVLKGRGMIDGELFARLDEDKPRRGADILRVRQLCLGR